METTFIMIKPDGVKRKLVGEVIQRFEKKGLSLKKIELVHVSEDIAKEHYSHLKEKSFFQELIDYITYGAVVAMVWEGEDAVALSRMLIGKTKVSEAEPGTIRGDFAFTMTENVIHGSDSVENANIEIKRFFS